MKIIFIPNLPYTYRDHKRFGVEYFIKQGYNVEVLDLHNIIVPGYKDRVKIDYFTFDSHLELDNKHDVLEKIKYLQSEDFIFYYTGSKKGIQLLHEMSKVTKAKFITYIEGSIPSAVEPCGLIKNIKSFIRKFIRRDRFETDYFVSGSPKDEILFSNLIGKNTKIIHANSSDYDLCLNAKGYIFEKPYCVFLDTDVINASDYELIDIKVKLDIENYLNKIINFFKWIENNFQIDVIISAHPKSRIYLNKDNLNGIKVVHGKSVELVKNAEFVINEGTTAVSYAVCFDKPMLFFTLSEISFFKHTCAFAKVFKKQIIGIDNPRDLLVSKIKKELNNKQNYQYYKNNYLTYTDDKVQAFEMLNNFFIRGK